MFQPVGHSVLAICSNGSVAYDFKAIAFHIDNTPSHYSVARINA